MDDFKEGYYSTPLYDHAKTMREEGIILTEKMAINEPYVLTSFPLDNGTIDLWDLEKVFRANNLHNCILSVEAPTAWWKSTFLLNECIRTQSVYYQLSKCSSTTWSLKNVLYSSSALKVRVRDMANHLTKDKRLWTSLLIDEQPQSRTARSGSDIVWSSDFEKQVRGLILNLFFSSPSLEAHVHHFIITPRDWNVFKRELRSLVYINTGQLIGSIITPFPPREILDKYNEVRKSKHLLDLLQLQNESMQQEMKIATVLASKREFLTKGIQGFPEMDFWKLNIATQKQYVMDKFGVTVMAQAKDIISKARDIYQQKYGIIQKQKRSALASIMEKYEDEDSDETT